jgi:hypothetical protein
MIGMLLAGWMAAATAAAVPQPLVVTPIGMWIMDPCQIVGNQDENPEHYSKADNARLARSAKLMEKKFATRAQCERAAARIPFMNYGPAIPDPRVSMRKWWYAICDSHEEGTPYGPPGAYSTNKPAPRWPDSSDPNVWDEWIRKGMPNN